MRLAGQAGPWHMQSARLAPRKLICASAVLPSAPPSIFLIFQPTPPPNHHLNQSSSSRSTAMRASCATPRLGARVSPSTAQTRRFASRPAAFSSIYNRSRGALTTTTRATDDFRPTSPEQQPDKQQPAVPTEKCPLPHDSTPAPTAAAAAATASASAQGSSSSVQGMKGPGWRVLPAGAAQQVNSNACACLCAVRAFGGWASSAVLCAHSVHCVYRGH